MSGKARLLLAHCMCCATEASPSDGIFRPIFGSACLPLDVRSLLKSELREAVTLKVCLLASLARDPSAQCTDALTHPSWHAAVRKSRRSAWDPCVHSGMSRRPVGVPRGALLRPSLTVAEAAAAHGRPAAPSRGQRSYSSRTARYLVRALPSQRHRAGKQRLCPSRMLNSIPAGPPPVWSDTETHLGFVV